MFFFLLEILKKKKIGKRDHTHSEYDILVWEIRDNKINEMIWRIDLKFIFTNGACLFFVSYIRFDVWVCCKWHTKRDSHINNAIVKVNFKFFTIILKIKQTFRTTLKNPVQDQSHGKQAHWILHGKFIVQMRKIKSKHVANSNVVYENGEKKKRIHSHFKLAYFNIVKVYTPWMAGISWIFYIVYE